MGREGRMASASEGWWIRQRTDAVNMSRSKALYELAPTWRLRRLSAP